MIEHKFEAGQRVIINENGHERVATISRVTPSGQVVIGNDRFNKYGRSIPYDTWHGCWIEPCTDDDYARIKKESFVRCVRNKMRNTDWSTVITDFETAMKFAEFMGWKKNENRVNRC